MTVRQSPDSSSMATGSPANVKSDKEPLWTHSF
jgi:hypothetical protein